MGDETVPAGPGDAEGRATDEARAFVRAQTRVVPVPLVPEVSLHVAGEVLDLWERTEERAGRTGLAPPFWAYPWAGGQALARHVLDDPASVAGRAVVDLACGPGLVGIAAATAGAALVVAVDVDRLAVAAAGLNARLNGVALTVRRADLLASDATATFREVVAMPADVVLVGDAFYDRATAQRMLPLLRRLRDEGADVLVGDPGRAHLPREALVEVSRHAVPVLAALEDRDVVDARVWRLR